MEKLLIKCKIVTPLLMHGADGKTPELRAQSFKGVMRFWWRAIHGNLSLDELKKREAEIFGDTKRKSSFSVKIFKNNNLKIDSFNPLPHKKESFLIKGFKPDQTFEIEFLGKNLESVKNIFLLSTILGGFGQRARRGFGSIQIVGNEVLTSSKQIEELVKKINPKFSFGIKSKKENYPYILNIKLGKNRKTDFNDLLKRIGETSHQYPYFGNTNPRFASPIYISIMKIEEKYYPIITELRVNFDFCYRCKLSKLKKENKYKKFVDYKECRKKTNIFDLLSYYKEKFEKAIL